MEIGQVKAKSQRDFNNTEQFTGNTHLEWSAEKVRNFIEGYILYYPRSFFVTPAKGSVEKVILWVSCFDSAQHDFLNDNNFQVTLSGVER